MSAFGSGLCLTLLLVCVIIDTLVEGSSWRRHHGHHSQYHGLRDPMSVNLMPKYSRNHQEDHSRHHDTYRQERRGYLADSFPSLEDENAEEVEKPVVHRHQEVPMSDFHQEFLQMRALDMKNRYEYGSARGVRHVRHGSLDQAGPSPSSEYEDEMQQAPVVHRRRQAAPSAYNRVHDLLSSHEKKRRKPYELEVREAQNSSVCSYIVEPIDDSYGLPKTLEHVKCKHAGSPCSGTDTHCCIQTYKMIGLPHNNRKMKLYVGCVCAEKIVLKQQEAENINN